MAATHYTSQVIGPQLAARYLLTAEVCDETTFTCFLHSEPMPATDADRR